MKEYKIKINAELLRRQLNEIKKHSPINPIWKNNLNVNQELLNENSLALKRLSDFEKKYHSSSDLTNNTVETQSLRISSFVHVYQCQANTSYTGELVSQREIPLALQRFGKGFIFVSSTNDIFIDSWENQMVLNAARFNGLSTSYTATDPNLQCFVDCCGGVSKQGAAFGNIWDTNSYPYGTPLFTNKNYWATRTFYDNKYYEKFDNYNRLVDYYGANNPAVLAIKTLDLSQNFSNLNMAGIISIGISLMMQRKQTDIDPNIKQLPITDHCKWFQFPEPNKWPAIVEWVYNGGILVIQTSYERNLYGFPDISNYIRDSCYPPSSSASSNELFMKDLINDLLSLFGGYIRLGGDISYNAKNGVSREYYAGAGQANIFYRALCKNDDYPNIDSLYTCNTRGWPYYYSREEIHYLNYLNKNNFLISGLYEGQRYGTPLYGPNARIDNGLSFSFASYLGEFYLVFQSNPSFRLLELSGNAEPLGYSDVIKNAIFLNTTYL